MPWRVMAQFGGAQTIQAVLDALVRHASEEFVRRASLPHHDCSWSSYRACLEASVARAHYPGLTAAVIIADHAKSQMPQRAQVLQLANEDGFIVIGEAASIEGGRIMLRQFGAVERMMPWPTISSVPDAHLVRRMLWHDEHMNHHTLCAVGVQIQNGEYLHARAAGWKLLDEAFQPTDPTPLTDTYRSLFPSP